MRKFDKFFQKLTLTGKKKNCTASDKNKDDKFLFLA